MSTTDNFTGVAAARWAQLSKLYWCRIQITTTLSAKSHLPNNPYNLPPLKLSKIKPSNVIEWYCRIIRKRKESIMTSKIRLLKMYHTQKRIHKTTSKFIDQIWYIRIEEGTIKTKGKIINLTRKRILMITGLKIRNRYPRTTLTFTFQIKKKKIWLKLAASMLTLTISKT